MASDTSFTDELTLGRYTKYEEEVELLFRPDENANKMLTPMEVGSLDSSGKLFDDAQKVIVRFNDNLDYVRTQITKKIDSFKQQNVLHATFGADQEEEQQLKSWQEDQVRSFSEEIRAEHSVPMDDFLCMVKAMAHLKT